MITFCISTHNNLPYLKIAVDSVRKNSYYKDAPFIIHAENCYDGTNEWLSDNAIKYNLTYFIEENKTPRGIGGGVNFAIEQVETEYVMLLHSDFYVTKDWDKVLLNIHLERPDDKLYLSSYRVEPQMFPNSQSRPGTVIVPKESFGAYYNDFDSERFEDWATDFKNMNDVQIPKGEGVSGLFKKSNWDLVGGNDPLFAPASWEDMDLFLRMLGEDFEFILDSQSVVWHFGARGSHRLEENNGKSSGRQLRVEKDNRRKWIEKWGSLPVFDEYGMICGLH